MPLTKSDKQGLLILGFVAAFVACVFLVYGVQKWTRPSVGPDNCVYVEKRFTKRAPVDQTIILVDQSEALTEGHKRFGKKLIQEYVGDEKRFPVGSRIMLFTSSKLDFSGQTPSGPNFRPNPDLCRPPSEGNELYENNKKITRTFYLRFLVPLFEALERSLSKEFGERSPILETLQFMSRSQDVEEWGKRKTLIIISDMLQHTDAFSHYRGQRTYEDFQSRVAKDVRADFRGWDIVVIYLRRYGDRNLQRADHLEFWERYFHDAGGKVVQWVGVD